MAGVERFERPTRAVFESRRNPLLYHWFYTSMYPNNGCKKASVFRLRLLKYGRGREIRTPNTRGFSRVGGIRCSIIGSIPQCTRITDVKKPQSFD